MALNKLSENKWKDTIAKMIEGDWNMLYAENFNLEFINQRPNFRL